MKRVSNSRLASAKIAAVGLSLFGFSLVVPIVASAVERRHSASKRRPHPLPRNPSVDVIVPAYLESGVIAAKIADLREGFEGYGGSSQIIVVASDPETAAASSAADLVISSTRSGKAAACNAGLGRSCADVVIFSDANCQIQPKREWLTLVLQELADWHLVSAHKGESGGMDGPFWALERRIKSSSGNSIGTLAVAGEFLATRRADLEPLDSGIILDDLHVAFSYAFRDLSVTVSNSIQTAESAVAPKDQWERRVRIAAGLISEALPLAPRLMATPIGRVFIAHKLVRATVGCGGFWLAAMGLAAIFPPISIVVIPLVLYAAAAYAGRAELPKPLQFLATVCGLQAIPIAGALRVLQNRACDRGRLGEGVWRKVAR